MNPCILILSLGNSRSMKLAHQAMTVVRRASSSSFPFLCFLLLAPLCRTSDAQGSAMIEAFRCSASGNYTPGDAYAANLDKFLAELPENAVSRNGGFFSGTVGEGAATVYGLAMCSADYSRADCGGCLAAVAGGNTGGLPTRCPGSATVHAVFDRCLVRYSDSNFLGSAEIDIIYTSGGVAPSSASTYSAKMKNVLQLLTDEAVASPQRFAANTTSPPFALVQCTWDLPPDKCKQCLEMLSANASDWWTMTIEGRRKSYSCSVRYSNTSFVVVPFSGASGSTASVGQKGAPAHDSHPVAMVVGTVIAVVVVAFLIGLVCNVRRLRRQQKRQVYAIKSFTYKQLAQATNNFAEDVKLGQGSFGAVYEGSGLPGIKENVAIKKILDTSADHTKRDFDNEISIMSQLHHRNILRLMGWCKEDKHLLLIYEIMKKGNLEDHLYPQIGASDSQVYGVMVDDTCSQLGWPRRRNVLIGIASGLAYLHTECPESIVHRDIKPGNVMLDMDFNAKLSDFGLVTQVNHTQTSRATMNIIGTRTYIDPAYIETGKTSGQSDVYSLGVMLLEIVCGEKPAIQTDDKNSLIEKVLKCQENNTILCAADKGLRGQFDGELKSVLEIGLMCVNPDRHRRPHIGRVRDLLMQLLPSNPTIPSGANGRGSTSSNTYPTHSPADEEAGDSPLLV